MTPTVRLTAQSAISILRAKFAAAGIEPEIRECKFKIDIERDTYRANKLPSKIGAGIRPIRQPKQRKGGSGPGKGNYEPSGHILELKYPFTCKFCGKSGLAKTKKRKLCDNNNECNYKFAVARRREAEAARGKVGG